MNSNGMGFEFEFEFEFFVEKLIDKEDETSKHYCSKLHPIGDNLNMYIP
jgi:hypothetical protein